MTLYNTHLKGVKDALERAWSIVTANQTEDYDILHAVVAVTEATLAVAEQQRIANLLALANCDEAGDGTRRLALRHAIDALADPTVGD